MAATNACYEIKVEAQLDQGWSDWFDGLHLSRTADGSTVLFGAVPDQAALHGLLARIRDLGLPLVSLRRVSPVDRVANAPLPLAVTGHRSIMAAPGQHGDLPSWARCSTLPTKGLAMATNIEIKARIADPEAVRRRAEALSGTSGQLIPQEDTFFPTPQGRLKLRQLAENDGQLVYYEREDTSGPKRSDYFTAPTGDPAALKAILATALGVRGVVRKQRLLFLVDNTRIHLDQVEGLGAFLELEVMLGPGQSQAEGEATAWHLLAELGVSEADLVEVAYMDLLEQADQASRINSS